MAETVDGERWREGKLERNTYISMRRGKYEPSGRFRPEIASKMNQTYWQMGQNPNSRSYETTSLSATSKVWNADLTGTLPRIHKNASEDPFEGYEPIPPQEHFQTVNQQVHVSTTHSKNYIKSKPMDGFDRLTANRTNYTLGKPEEKNYMETKTHSHVAFNNPEEREKVEQADIGGWMSRHGPPGQYFNDVGTREYIKRGGTGAAGVFGYDFNIVTGEKRKDGYNQLSRNRVYNFMKNQKEPLVKREGLLKHTIPKVSQNIIDYKARNMNMFGDTNTPINPVNALPVPKVTKPDVIPPHLLKRKDEPILRTRPW